MILVFGKTGQVARALAMAEEVICLDRAAADLSDPDACAAAIRAHRPSAVINAAAYTAVDDAEKDEARATIINGAAPTAMAETCAQLAIPFVHLSTDYVFDGAGDTPFTPDHSPHPLGAYGRSKLAGETGVRAAGGAAVILRTSWVFSAHGNNFLKTMLRLGVTRTALNVVADQIGGPTPARAIATACLTIAAQLRQDPSAAGIYHYSGAPDVSWADFARAIFDAADLDCTVSDIPSSDYPTPAERPQNSRLACETLAVFGLNRPDWRAAAQDIVTNLEKRP